MGKPLRVLLTGSRNWADENTIRKALETELQGFPMGTPVVLVHGACEIGGAGAGADWLADQIWSDWVRRWPTLFEPAERYPAANFSDPKTRNRHMVNMGAEVCLAFATNWISGTGNCARLARKARIRTVDYGVPTGYRDRPECAA